MAYYCCSYCGHRGNGVSRHGDHWIPKSWNVGNFGVVDSCDECNQAKGNKDEVMFAGWILRTGWRPSWSDANLEPFIRRVQRDYGFSRRDLLDTLR